MRIDDMDVQEVGELLRAMTSAALQCARSRGVSMLDLTLVTVDMGAMRCQLYSTLSPGDTRKILLVTTETLQDPEAVPYIVCKDGVTRPQAEARSMGVDGVLDPEGDDGA